MICVWQLIVEKIKKFDNDRLDHRIANYMLANKPIHVVAITALYYIFVKIVGPKLMANREPFELKRVLIVYNVLQVVINISLFSKSFYHLVVDAPYNSWTCMLPIDESRSLATTEVNLYYAYFLMKIVDFLDTVFFVLRKRFHQVTFLHVYHHIVICLGGYLCLRYLPGGHTSLLGMVNMGVHAVMYFYYLVAALRPQLSLLWWKKYITQLQIAQFVFLIVHFAIGFLNSSCSYSKMTLFLVFLQNAVMLVLFVDFYVKAYLVKKPRKVAMDAGEERNVNKIK